MLDTHNLAFNLQLCLCILCYCTVYTHPKQNFNNSSGLYVFELLHFNNYILGCLLWNSNGWSVEDKIYGCFQSLPEMV